MEEVSANEIQLTDEIFDSLREDYPPFDTWWRDKCVRERRRCWAVFDEGLAGLIVRKDETAANTDATIKAAKILKICTFKVRPEKRGVKLGELLLKKVFWFAQANHYDLVYITTYKTQAALIDLLEYYGFKNTATKADGELIYEKTFTRNALVPGWASPTSSAIGSTIRASQRAQAAGQHHPQGLSLPCAVCAWAARFAAGVLQRKVAKPALAGADGGWHFRGVLYGVFHEGPHAADGGRSVYSEAELNEWEATAGRPVKVINYLLAAYIEPAITLDELRSLGVIPGHPPQSIFELSREHLEALLPRMNLGFAT